MPLSEIAGTPRPCRHIATSGAVIVSPFATSASSSRGGGSRETSPARPIRRSVVWPIPDTTATTWLPFCTVCAIPFDRPVGFPGRLRLALEQEVDRQREDVEAGAEVGDRRRDTDAGGHR